MTVTQNLQTRFIRLWSSRGVWDGLVMTGATFLAGFLDYLYNILTGRLLPPTEYSVLIAVLAILQILLHLTNVIRNVVAYYAAELHTKADASSAISNFFRLSYRWGWQWGVVATSILALLSPWLATRLQLPTSQPLYAASLALLMLFVRPVTDGVLQGVQHFWALAGVTILQAVLRLGLAVLFIVWGWQAFGAVLALPLAMGCGLLLALWHLRPYFGQPITSPTQTVSWHYSMITLVGMGSFALLVNADAILVRAFFAPEIAGNYAPVITLGKINLFLPLAVAMVLFPKAVARHQVGRETRPLLLASLVAALLPGFGLTVSFFLFPELILSLLFGGDYVVLGHVMGLVGAATTLFAGISIWLQFALSTKRPHYVSVLVIIVLLQIGTMWFFHAEIDYMVWSMLGAGIAGNIAGAWFNLRP